MPCSSITLTGITLDCGNSGGVSAIYLAPTPDVSGITLNATGEVTAIGLTSANIFKRFSFRKGNADFSFNGSKDVKMGTTSVETTINMQFNKMENVKRNEIAQLLSGVVYGIVKDNNSTYWLIGYEAASSAYLDLTSVDGSTGAEIKDGNMYKLVLTASTSVQPYQITEAAALAVIA